MASTQLAKMRFTNQIEKAQTGANKKQIEIENDMAAKEYKAEREKEMRQTGLFNMTSHNLQMHTDLRKK